MSDHSFLKILRRSIRESGGSMSAWAKARGIPKQLVSAVLIGRRAPSPALLKSLGYARCSTILRRVQEPGA